MATSGEYTATFNGTYGDSVGLKLIWSVTKQYKSSGMYSSVTVKLQMRKTQSYNNWYNSNASYSISINGTAYTGNFAMDIRSYTVNTWYDIGVSKSVNVKHGSDGTKSCEFSATINTGLSGGSATASGTGTFNTIPIFAWSKTIAAGQPVTNLTAADWNKLNGYIKSYIKTDHSYTTVSTGTAITRALIKQAADVLGVTINTGNILASYFTSIRDRYNAY